MQKGNETYEVRITEACAYCPETGPKETLKPGDERTMAGDDAFNIVSSGRGVFVNPDDVPSSLKGSHSPGRAK